MPFWSIPRKLELRLAERSRIACRFDRVRAVCYAAEEVVLGGGTA